MLDHSNLNIYEQDALNTAFENIDSFIESRSCTQRHLKGNQLIQKYDTDCIRQFPVGGNTEQNTLNPVRDESREVGMKMSTGGGCFEEVSSKPLGCFGEVQAGRSNGGDALNAIRDESREIGMTMSTGGGCFGEVSSKPTGCFGEVQVVRNNGGDALNATRGECREVTVMMST